MAISIKHAFQSAKGDGGDATLVRPSNWNADHATSMATGKLLGRLTAGTGAFEEIPISAFIANALNSADGAAFLAALGVGGFNTGDVKWSYRINPPDPGWIIWDNVNGTIGNAASGATIRANADCLALWTLLYTNVVDTYAPVSGGRTGNAVTDFNAGKTMRLNLTGRAPVGAGNGTTGITTRALGTTFGAETHTLLETESATHYHPVFLYDPGHAHGFTAAVAGSSTGGGAFGAAGPPQAAGTALATTGISVRDTAGGGGTANRTATAGGGQAHNNMQPSVALYAHVKL